jgi:predicted amidohydrolase YtcJ
MKPRPSGDVGAVALVNGRLAGSYGSTLDLGAGRPTAILIEDGRIAQLGDDDTVRRLAGRRGRAIDVGGAVIAPGIVDAHMHAFDCALASLRVSCLPPAVGSLTDLQRCLADRAGSRSPGAWVVATGYDDTRLREKRHPSRLDVDSAVPHHPAVVGRVWAI